MPVDRPGDVGADIGVRNRFAAFSEDAGVGQSVDPEFPVFAAHDGDGVGYLFFGGRLDFGFDDGVFIGVDGGGFVRLADRLQAGADDFAGVRHFAHGGRQ